MRSILAYFNALGMEFVSLGSRSHDAENRVLLQPMELVDKGVSGVLLYCLDPIADMPGSDLNREPWE